MLLQECAKIYRPDRYMSQLPSLKLPYVGHMEIPINTGTIKPTPAMQTRAVRVVTKYVYKNPVCIKATKKKTCPMATTTKHKGGEDEIVTKEYFVQDKEQNQRNGKHVDLGGEDDDTVWNSNLLEAHYDPYEEIQETRDETFNDFIAPSETPFYSSRKQTKTPNLSGKKVYDMLIEDRLDQLETILPHYVRRRVYQTSTITMTKVLNNKRTMATLTVKNCIPPGYQFCVTKNKKRKSKVAKFTNNTNESLFYFG
ncbi:unnamed protein product [Acanthoscelides obtectus]|uniref:Uncharacterized protein n=2 Tax=Acanthoscelides obtectus TaxID=200917 RepID=A0A9P0MKV8_ACAOB|nr:unnamed protein product [Acanthoscelides obtectus]CAK1625340.1 hypothetical protein AOBTE_LOCUS3115 [Acanthoscelides obtectus]